MYVVYESQMQMQKLKLSKDKFEYKYCYKGKTNAENTNTKIRTVCRHKAFELHQLNKYKHAFALSPMELNQGAKISTSVLPFSDFHTVSLFLFSNSIRTRRRVHLCHTFHLSLDSVADSELYSKRKWDYWRKKTFFVQIILPHFAFSDSIKFCRKEWVGDGLG